jgi:hypothetical protein
MGGRMTINSLRIGRDLSNVAIKFQALPEETNRTRFDKIIARFIEGNVSTGLTGPEKAAYDTVLRAGVYEMANLAFQKTDSLLIHKIIKEKSWLLTKLQELLQLKVAFIQWTHLLYVLR